MRRSFKIAVILFLFGTSGLWAQQLASPYAVSFIPKSVLIDTLNPSSILSNRAVERRSKQGIELSKTDVPIQRTYLSKIKSIVVGLPCDCISSMSSPVYEEGAL